MGRFFSLSEQIWVVERLQGLLEKQGTPELAVRLGYDTDLLAAVCEKLARALMQDQRRDGQGAAAALRRRLHALHSR